MFDLEVKMAGGKNLSKIDWRSRGYLQEVLPWAARQIRNRVLSKGTTADGRPLPRYSKRYQRALEKQGESPSRVDYNRTGQMWRSLKAKVDAKGRGVVSFTGAHRDTLGRKVKVRKKKKDGSYSSRNLTNQMLASILAFRQPGKGMPSKPYGRFVPQYAFMDLGVAESSAAVRRYHKYWRQKVAAAPQAIGG